MCGSFKSSKGKWESKLNLYINPLVGPSIWRSIFSTHGSTFKQQTPAFWSGWRCWGSWSFQPFAGRLHLREVCGNQSTSLMVGPCVIWMEVSYSIEWTYPKSSWILTNTHGFGDPPFLFNYTIFAGDSPYKLWKPLRRFHLQIYSFSPLLVISTCNPIYRMHNPIYNQLYLIKIVWISVTPWG